MDEIAKLLEQADTPRDRAFLLIMYKIADKLGDLDNAINAHRKEFIEHRDTATVRHELFDSKFDIHVRDEQGLLNKGLGAWMVLTGVLVLVLSFGGWYIIRHILDVAAQQAAVVDRNSNRLTVIETLIQRHLQEIAK